MNGFRKKTLALLCAIVLISSASVTLATITYLTIPSTGHIRVKPAGLTTTGNLDWGTFDNGVTQSDIPYP